MGRSELSGESRPGDVALDVSGRTLDDLFAAAARTLAEVMLDPTTLSRDVERKVALVASRPDLLLHGWVSELIFRKDRDREVFPEARVRVARGEGWRLRARLRGGVADPSRAVLRADPRAAVFHQLTLEERAGGWSARVVVDVSRPDAGRAAALRDGPARFRDRAEAGQHLAAVLAGTLPAPCLVAAIPRGGVEVALPVARTLEVPLRVAYARKLEAPSAPGMAFGALDEDGALITSRPAMAALGLTDADVAEARARAEAEIRRRMARYGEAPLARDLPGAALLLVDDRLTTGLTMRAAVAYARRHGAREVTVAVPCASAGAAARVAREADRLVAPVVGGERLGPGDCYEHVPPVTDERVLELLGRSRGRPPGGGAGAA